MNATATAKSAMPRRAGFSPPAPAPARGAHASEDPPGAREAGALSLWPVWPSRQLSALMEVMRPAGGGNGLPDGLDAWWPNWPWELHHHPGRRGRHLLHCSHMWVWPQRINCTLGSHRIASHLIHGEVMPPHGHGHASTNTPRLITFAPTRCCFYFLSFELMGWDVYFLF